MSLRVCSGPGAGERCPTAEITDKPQCAKCRRSRERARGTRQQRGYDAAHQAERARWAPIVATGGVKCWRCEAVLDPDLPWDLGHDDRDRSKYRGPECIRCNRATATRR